MKIYTAILTGTAILTLGTASHSAFAFDLYNINNNAQAMYTSNLQLVNGVDAREANAEAFIEKMANQGIGFLSDPTLSLDKRKSEFKKLLNNNFDMKSLSRFSLGRYWNVATKSERAEYQKLFEKMIIDVYSRRFSDYQGQSFEVVSARADGKADAIVRSFIQADNQKISVDWRVRNKKGQTKVIDIIVEGVSMATTQRSEFSSIIQRGGGQVKALIEHLKG